MAGINVTGFIGALPGKDPQLLPETAAVYARNNRVESGALDPVFVPRLLKAADPATKFVYRIPNGRPAVIDEAYWIEFKDRDTDVVRTPVVNDNFKRYYWASPSTGFKYATEAVLITNGPDSGLTAGVARPTTAPTLDVIAGTGADHTNDDVLKLTRSYVVTFVSAFGEEGAPGPAAEATGYGDQDWRLRDIPQPVTQAGYSDVTIIRIYRTVTAQSGSTVFNRVVDLAVGTTTYIDRLSDVAVSGALQLDAVNADMPPSMDGITLMPNGVLVGFKGNNLYFSDNFKPHAWPAAYTLTVQHPIVGLAVFGNTCVVATVGNPCAVVGASGAVMTLTQSDTSMPCVSRQSIVVAPEGVYFATTTGLVLYGASGPTIVSNDIFGGQEWEASYSPQTMDAVMYRGQYTTTFEREGGRPAFTVTSGSVVEFDETVTGLVGLDVYSNRPWLLKGSTIYEWLPSYGSRATVEWRSKEFVLLNRVTFGCAQVYFDQTPGGVVVLRVYAEGVLWHTQIVTSQEPFRLPAGAKYDRWSFTIAANTRVHRVTIAETITDLKRV